MRVRIGAPAALVPAAVLCAALSGGPSPVAAAPDRTVALPMRGAPVEGEFQGITAEGVRFAGRADPVPLGTLRELRFAPDGPPSAADAGTRIRVTLRGDETIRGTFASGSEEGLEVRPPDFPVVKIPFDAIRRIEAEAAFTGRCDEPGRDRPPRPGTDLAWSKSGDAFPGTLVSASSAGLVIEGAGDRRTTLAWSDLVVMHLDEPALPAPEGLVAEVETTGGSRLTATSVTGDASRLAITTRSGVAVEVPTSSVRAVRWSGGAFVYASDLPYESEFAPYYGDDLYEKAFLERWYGARSDRTPSGCPLRIAGTSFRHGIAVHAKSVVRVPLRKAFTSFDCRFGIDDEAVARSEGPRGDVTARVLADGREVWTSGGSVRGGDAPRAVGPIDVTGVDVLTLEVDFGKEQHQMDRADWADPLLVRGERTKP